MPTREIPYSEEMDDGRRKVAKSDHHRIQEDYKKTGSMRAVARLWGIDRGTVKNILQPGWYEKQLEARKKNEVWYRYYDKGKRREYMQKYRAKKRDMGLVQSVKRTKKIKKEKSV